MFYNVEAQVADLFDAKGNEIPRVNRKYRTERFKVFSKNKVDAMGKAGQNISARELTHNGLVII